MTNHIRCRFEPRRAGISGKEQGASSSLMAPELNRQASLEAVVCWANKEQGMNKKLRVDDNRHPPGVYTLSLVRDHWS